LYDKAMAGYRGSGMMANFAGVEEIGGVASVPTTGWFVVSHIPTSQALATVSRAQRYVAANSIVVTLGFLLFATGGMVLIFKPLLWAARHADRMTLGEIPLEPMPVVRNDEVGHLTQAFNRLLAKLQLQQADLERMAHHDPLTGLPNRTLLADRLQQVLSHAQRNGLRVAVLYIDLDGFKPINDTLGHAAGDEALKEVALRLAATVRESDTLARIGGDEFVVVMRDLDADILRAQAAALVVAEKCQHAFDTPLHLVGQALQLGASIGVAVSDGLASANALRRTADGAMYQAKKAGGHRVVLASS
jgi:diguanylate cyclase (GGDEF)-like protein